MLATLANAGLPTFALQAPAMLLMLWPIVEIEAWALRRWVSPAIVRPRRMALLANLWSTLLGVPIAYVLVGFGGWALAGSGVQPLVNVGRVIGSAYLLDGTSDVSAWGYLVGTIVVFVPLMAASVVVERAAYGSMLRGSPHASLWKAAWIGNILSYLALTVTYLFLMPLVLTLVFKFF